MAVITVSEVKTLLQISDSSKDALITALIPMVQDEVIEYCNYGFGTDLDPVAEDWPSGIKIPVAKMIGYNMAQMSGGGASIGLQSETQGGYSYQREGSNGSGSQVSGGYPPSIYTSLDKWRRVSVKNPQKLTQFRDRRLLTLQQIASGGARYFVPGQPIDEDEIVIQ